MGPRFSTGLFSAGSVLRRLGRPQVAAFTATATPEVRADIVKRLGLETPSLFVAGFARPNLRFVVTETERESEKYNRLRELIRHHRTGIVYCATRKRVDQVSAELKTWGIRVVSYHGGIDDAGREEAQSRFTQSDCEVAVATNAFGMGIDRADLRFVVHFEIPGSLEAYYQEAGRAGRDGEPAECELLFNYADTRIQDFFINGSNPSVELIRSIYLLLRNMANGQGEIERSIHDLTARLGHDNEMAVHSAITVLDRLSVIDRYDIPGKRIRGTRLLQPDLQPFQLPIDVAALRDKEKRDKAKLKAMVDYAYGRECRQKVILRYFGDTDFSACGACDRCSSVRSKKIRPPSEEELLLVRKALSGVARMCYRTKEGFMPRFGRNRVIQVLVGSQGKEVLDAGLNELTTYGLLKQKSTNYLHELFREMEEAELIYSTGGQYPMIGLAELGVAVMQNVASFDLVWPEEQKSRKGKEMDRELENEAPFDRDLFEVLRKTRATLAQEQGGVPHFVIFPDETLKAFSRLKPSSIESARRIRGVGEVKAAKYMAPFLEAIREFGLRGSSVGNGDTGSGTPA